MLFCVAFVILFTKNQKRVSIICTLKIIKEIFFQLEISKYKKAVRINDMSPLSVVITGALSVILRTDTPTPSFILGAIIVLCAVILAGLSDISADKKEKSLDFSREQ